MLSKFRDDQTNSRGVMDDYIRKKGKTWLGYVDDNFVNTQRLRQRLTSLESRH